MENKILVETSARHIHLTEAHIAALFGEGHTLTVKKMLSQPGQFACEEKVTVKGEKGELKMSVLGPARSATQVEVSLTDARTLGVTAPVRESGDIARLRLLHADRTVRHGRAFRGRHCRAETHSPDSGNGEGTWRLRQGDR